MITCTRRIEFDAAHRILNHESKCKMLHGHRYVVEEHGEIVGGAVLSQHDPSVETRLIKAPLINRTIAKETTPEAKLDALFLSILNRHPTDREKAIAQKALQEFGASEGYSNIIWSLINTREFCFVQ